MPRSLQQDSPSAQMLAGHIQPMLAVLGDMPRRPGEWGFEYKWDGVRAIAYWDGRRLRVESRNLLSVTARYPELGELTGRLRGRQAVLDGEIVAMDDHGRVSFSALQRRMHLTDPKVAAAARIVPVHYFIFDVLLLDDRVTMDLPYLQRRELLEGLGLEGDLCRVPPSHVGRGAEMLRNAREHTIEGVMAKRVGSAYQPGRRSGDWLKIKILGRQELVIGGWTTQEGDASRIGALLLGYYDDAGELHYAGRVGSGFTDATHRLLLSRLKPLTSEQNPFAERPPGRSVTFVQPRVVAEVEYRRWPAGMQIQQAAFKGLRDDKPARDVRRESLEDR